MGRWPIRRAQLIAPFGVGAMTVLKDGVSVITCGLDHWYEREGEVSDGIHIDEFVFHEWRLERLLCVKELRLPPDYRTPFKGSPINDNVYLTVPFLRFPEWHFCPSCHLLKSVPSSHAGAFYCPECQRTRKKSYGMLQVPFIAICDQGHIQDFPWREWVHKSINAGCSKPMRLVATGGASLGAQRVDCDCGESRTLMGITEHGQNSSFLSDNLSEEPFLCCGRSTWLGPGATTACFRPLKGSLRSASNVYFAQVKNAIFLPQGRGKALEELVEALQKPPLSGAVTLFENIGQALTAASLRQLYRAQLEKFSDDDIQDAISDVIGPPSSEASAAKVKEDEETSFRREEFDALRRDRNEDQLMTSLVSRDAYSGAFERYFEAVVLVNKLRETRVLSGFTRIYPENDVPLQEKKNMLRSEQIATDKEWLPAYKVFGEGLLIVFREATLRIWENQWKDVLKERLKPLIENYALIRARRKLPPKTLSARFVLVHTFAHILMNQLTFECGYSSAAIRERLYVSEDKDHPMAAVLVYTAAGDAEGTMGGLVRMGKPGYLEPVVDKALSRAKWCSADPVCMEQGERGGQGPDSCNLAACHNCALVPETACEEFNRFLDRGIVVGTLKSTIGYFC